MTGGRAGYVTWGVTGLVLGVVRWRKLLPILPVAAAIVLICLPSVRERMLYGFGVTQSGSYVQETDTSELPPPDRDVAVCYRENQGISAHWLRSLAMIRTGLAQRMQDELREVFDHPHNAYLEMLFDDGIVGFACVIPIYFMLFTRCVSLFRDKEDLLVSATGGVALSLLLGLLVATGAQTLYPREGVHLECGQLWAWRYAYGWNVSASTQLANPTWQKIALISMRSRNHWNPRCSPLPTYER